MSRKAARGSSLSRSGARARTRRDAPRAAATVPDFVYGILAVSLGLLAWIWFRVSTGIVYEDALITYRYAENLATGHGLVYNAGERVLGTTSPLFSVLLGALAAVFGVANLPLISNVALFLAGAGAQALLFATLRRAGVPILAAALAVTFAGIHPAVVWATASGLETPLVLFFMAAGLHSVAAGRWNRAAAACGLLVLTRIDGVVWALVLAGIAIWKLRTAAWRPLLLAVGIVLPWFVFSAAYYGSLLPQSMLAKLEIHPARVDYTTWFAETLWPITSNPIRAAIPLWSILVLAGVRAVLRSSRRPLLPLALFPPLLMAVFAFGRAPQFPWYLTPASWCLAVLGVVGSAWIVDVADRGVLLRRAALAGVLGVWIVLGFAIARRFEEDLLISSTEQTNELGLRRAAGEWIRESTPPGAAIAMEAIGYQGTTSRRRIIDLAGLISPAVVRIHRESRTNAEAFARVLRELRPGGLLLRTYEVESNRHALGGALFSTPAERDSFFAHYAEARRFRAPYPELWGENSYLTYWTRVR